MLYFAHKTAKYILSHIKNKCLQLTTTEKKEKLKEIEFLWNPEEDIAVYFKKLHKDQERLKILE